MPRHRGKMTSNYATSFGNDSTLKQHPNRYEGEWLDGEKTGLGKVYVCNDGSFPYLDIYHRNDYTRKYNIEKRQYHCPNCGHKGKIKLEAEITT